MIHQLFSVLPNLKGEILVTVKRCSKVFCVEGGGGGSYVKFKSDMLNTIFIFMFRIFTKIVQTLKMEKSCSGPKVECSSTVFTNKYLACYFSSLSRNFFPLPSRNLIWILFW